MPNPNELHPVAPQPKPADPNEQHRVIRQPLPDKQVVGTSEAGAGVIGSSGGDSGVAGDSFTGPGVSGVGNPGVRGEGGGKNAFVGVEGIGNRTGVVGRSLAGTGVWGISETTGAGVVGESKTGGGVTGFAHASDQSGIFGMNDATGAVPEGLNRPAGNGVWGHTRTEKGSGVCGSVEPGLTAAAGVTGIGPIAGQFFGDVIVTGDVRLSNGDCAEEFDIADDVALLPGTVVVIDQRGAVVQCRQPYDKKVAGVISGAGDLKPAIILGKQEPRQDRMPIALLGKVYCRVDAQHGAIEIGDLLTTSPTPGHAMKAADPTRAFGAVVGKALLPLDSGQGFIPILIALQ